MHPLPNTISEKNLHYVSQTPDTYTATTESGKAVTIRKAFIQTEHTPRKGSRLDTWLTYAAIGLPIGGIPTVVLAPYIVWKTIEILQNKEVSKQERIHAKQTLIVSIIFSLLSFVLFALFIMHLVY